MRIKRYIFDNEKLGRCNIGFDSILLFLTLVSSLTVFFLDRNLNMPAMIKIITDLLVFAVLCKVSYVLLTKKKKVTIGVWITAIFTIISVISWILNKYSFFNFVTVFEFDYFRFLVVYLGVIYLEFEKEELIKLFKILNIYLLIQVPISLVMYYIFKPRWSPKYGIMQDFICGLLGGKSTGELGGYICIAIITYYVLCRFKKMSYIRAAIYSALLLFMAILGEIKFILLLLPVLLICTYIKGNAKGYIAILLTSAVILFGGIFLTSKIYGDFNNILSKEAMYNYLNYNYAESNLSRLNSVAVANKVIKNKPQTMLLGRGVGNTANTVNNPSKFAKQNKYLFKMFTWSYILAETGYLGLILIGSIYVLNIVYAVKLIRNSDNQLRQIIGTIGIPAILLFVVLNFYNMAMTKINFGIAAWMMLGLISRSYYEEKGLL